MKKISYTHTHIHTYNIDFKQMYVEFSRCVEKLTDAINILREV